MVNTRRFPAGRLGIALGIGDIVLGIGAGGQPGSIGVVDDAMAYVGLGA